MKRTDLLKKLEIVAPALAVNDIVASMQYFWFTGNGLLAHNGTIAIRVPFETDFECGVYGTTFLNLIKAVGAKNVELTLQGDQLHIKAASFRGKLVTMDKDQLAFKMFTAPKDELKTNTKDFLACVETCLRSVSGDTSVPDQLGVTMLPGKKRIVFYSTNWSTLSRAEVEFKGEVAFKGRAILPTAFCKQLLEIASEDAPLKFDIVKDRAMFAGPNGVLLWGQLVEADKPLRFSEIFDKYHAVSDDKKLVPIATKLARILERACIVAAAEVKTVQTQIEIKDSSATFFTKATVGEIRDKMELPKGHGDVFLEIDAKLVKAGCGSFDRMLITEQCFIMANDNAYYLISGKA